MRSCPECGAETPLVSGLEQADLCVNEGAGSPSAGITGAPSLGKFNTSPSNLQSSPFPVSATKELHLIQPGAENHRLSADTKTRLPRTAQVAAVSVVATICVLA